MNLSEYEIQTLATFKEHRNIQSERISKLSKQISDISNIPVLQMELYLLRQDIVERRVKTSLKLLEISKVKEKQRHERSEFLIEKADQRYNASQIKSKIEGELREFISIIDILSAWVDYESESLKTVDNMLYGIKNRIDAQQYFTMGLK